jgi:hypothetical protein
MGTGGALKMIENRIIVPAKGIIFINWSFFNQGNQVNQKGTFLTLKNLL